MNHSCQKGLHHLTCALDRQAHHIAADKQSRKASWLDQSERLTVGGQDDPAQAHVDGGREEYGCEECEHVLHQVGPHGEVRCFIAGEDAADVTYRFAWGLRVSIQDMSKVDRVGVQ